MSLFKNSNSNKAFISLLIASIIWGATAPIMKWTLLITPVFLLAFLRFFFASIILLLFKPKLHIAKSDIPLVVIASLLGVTFNISFFFYGIKYSSAINAGIIGSSVPIITLVASFWFLKEKVSKGMIIGAGLGMFGILVIMLEPLFKSGLSQNALGNLFHLVATFSWVGFEMISKKLFKTYSPLTITFYSFAIGALTFLPFCFSDLFNILPKVIFNSQFLIGTVYGIIFSSTIAYYFWQWGLSKFDAARVGFFQYLNPVVTTIVAFFLLGEEITMFFITGAIFIFSGLFIAEKRHPLSVYHHKLKLPKSTHEEYI